MKMRVLVAIGLTAVLGGAAQAQEPAWTAKWIQAPWSTERDGAEADGSKPMPMFQHEFKVSRKVAHAELRIAGLGQFTAGIVGPGSRRFNTPPGLHQSWTNYRKTVGYESYDVTNAVQPGAHVITVLLGNGMYNVQKSLMENGKARYTKFEGSFGPPKMIAEIRITYADGKTEVIGSNETWKVTRGPILFSSIYGGEDYDARKALSASARVGFDYMGWDDAKVVEGPGGRLGKATATEVLQATSHKPVKITEISSGKTIYDLGQNFAGVPSIRARAALGTVLKLTPGELLKPDGSVSQASSGSPMWWTYTFSGSTDGEEFKPKFGYYGFRYLQAEWIGVDPTAVGTPAAKIDEVNGIEWHSASKVTGKFETSNAMLNSIHKLIVEAMHNNEVSIFTDCPHREKLGWLEETHLAASGLMFNNDLRGLYAATDQNMADSQRDDGDVPTTAPQYTQFGKKYSVFDDSPEWGSASVLAPWAAYRFYGDKAQLEKDYPVMQRYVAYLQSGAKDGIVSYGLGDWYDIGPGAPGFSKLTTQGVTGTLMLYEDAAAMVKIAALLGKDADAAMYAALATTEKDKFNERFFDAAAGFYDKGSQTAQAMPLALGIVPESAKAGVLAKLIADIHAHEDHVTTGEIGYAYLVRALMQNSRSDILMAMMMRKDPPSYGSQLAAGATALTEAWDANPKSSQDHFMLGHAEEWFYRGLGGIDFDMSRAPDERITIRPQVVPGVDSVRVGFDSALGRIETSWSHGPASTTYDLTVPNSAKATIILPGISEVVGSGPHHYVMKNAAK